MQRLKRKCLTNRTQQNQRQRRLSQNRKEEFRLRRSEETILDIDLDSDDVPHQAQGRPANVNFELDLEDLESTSRYRRT